MKAMLGVGWLGHPLAAAGVAALGLVLGGCGVDEGPYLQTEFYETKAGESEVYMGGSCMPVQEGNAGMGGGTAPGATDSQGLQVRYQYTYESTGDGVLFVFTDHGSGAKEERNYDGAFIASGERDDVVVEVGADQRRFVNWGVSACEPIRDPQP